MRLIPLVHENSKGVYHGDGLHPGDEPKDTLFIMRSCRSIFEWCKCCQQALGVLSFYDISDSINNNLAFILIAQA
jgi:hypothetical protein